MTNLIRSLPGIFFASFLIFGLLNLGAAIYLDHFPRYDVDRDLFIPPFSDAGQEIRARVFATDNWDELDAWASTPGIRPHPVLAFVEGRSKPHYRVGVEGIRYSPGWTDEDVVQSLARSSPIFVMGGSTTFGDGVPDEHTAVAYLNKKDRVSNYFNLAVQAYDSKREVDKLLYLLRKGYRPSNVIFVDGLNEVTTFASSPYEMADSPRSQGLVLDRGEIPAIFGLPVSENMWMALAYSLPVTHLLSGARQERYSSIEEFERRSGREIGLEDWQELLHLYYYWPEVHVQRLDALANEIVEYYRKNIAFVRQLGEAFGFTSWFVYQPIGLLDERNPFLTEKFLSSNYRRAYQATNRAFLDAIRDGSLDMIDCSVAIENVPPGYGYVDATHFSPAGNEALADCIYSAIQEPQNSALGGETGIRDPQEEQ